MVATRPEPVVVGPSPPLLRKRQKSVRALLHVARTICALIDLWESYQVELQGSYSVARLQELVAFSNATSWWRALAVVAFTPIPSIAAIVLADVLPLQPPADGLRAQGAVYWVRTYFSVSVITITSLSQFYHSSPRLPLKASQAVLLTLSVTTTTVVFILGLHVVIGFPTPFLYQNATWCWHVMLVLCMWLIWKKAIREDPNTRQDVQRFLWCWLSQLTMILVYPVFSFAFSTLSGVYQTWISFLLPVWKLGLKIWASYGVFRIEDSAPVFVVFTVDVFHALFLSCAMQSTVDSGSNALAVIMLVDVFQNCVALNYVWIICFRLRRLGNRIDAMEAKAGPSSSSIDPSRSQTSLLRANAIVSASQTIREHPMIAGARHQRAPEPTQAQVAPVDTHFHQRRLSLSAPLAAYVAESSVADDGRHRVAQAAPTTTSISVLDDVRLQYVRETLRLLHMVEFYMLIEFTEVIVATVYSIYLVIMSRLPNRVYYLQLRDMTSQQWHVSVAHVVKYAALELLSFVVLALVLRWRLRYSPLRQIAFAIHKHWWLVQSLLCLWVFFVIQMSLEHLGSDYSFKFKWLKHKADDPARSQ